MLCVYLRLSPTHDLTGQEKKATYYICLTYFKSVYTRDLCFNESVLTFWSSEIAFVATKQVQKCNRLFVFGTMRRHLTHIKKKLSPLMYQQVIYFFFN